MYGNTFSDIFSYYGTTGVFIRNRVTSVSSTDDITSETDLECGGFFISSNTFTGSYSCPKYGTGVVEFECIQDSETIDANDESIKSAVASAPSDTAQALVHK